MNEDKLNPYESPLKETPPNESGFEFEEDVQLSKRIDRIEHRMREVPVVIIFACFIPLVWIAIVPLGLIEVIQRASLVNQYRLGQLILTAEQERKIEFIAQRPLRFFLPAIFSVIYFVLLCGFLSALPGHDDNAPMKFEHGLTPVEVEP